MKIATIVGARPQFVKSAIVSRALHESPTLTEIIVHTGQHYDERMSDVFFNELGIPTPKHQLKIGSGTHGDQTGRMLIAIEKVLQQEQPDMVLVYGDTNSTLAGSLAAVKLQIPIAHIEAGLRSFNRRMPEEINRVMTDHISSLLFCPTQEAVTNLAAEGITKNVHCVGDVMYDCSQYFSQKAAKLCDPLSDYGIDSGNYILLTCHRPENTDCPDRLAEIQQAIVKMCQFSPVVFPVHPRVRESLEDFFKNPPTGLLAISPVPYLEMIELTKNASVVVTDSGGLQKEAFFFGVPCVTMRDETEWNETVRAGANQLTGASTLKILEAVSNQRTKRGKIPDAGPFYGEGRAAKVITHLINEFYQS